MSIEEQRRDVVADEFFCTPLRVERLLHLGGVQWRIERPDVVVEERESRFALATWPSDARAAVEFSGTGRARQL